MKVLIFKKGKLVGSKEWQRPPMNARRSKLLASNPQGFAFMRGLRTRSSKTDPLNLAGKTMANRYLDLLLKPSYLESSGTSSVFFTGVDTKKRILEALNQPFALSVDQLLGIVKGNRTTLRNALLDLRKEGRVGYALRSSLQAPLFCLPDSEYFLGFTLEGYGVDDLVIRALEEHGSLAVLELAQKTGYSPVACRKALKKLEACGQVQVCGKSGTGYYKAKVYKLHETNQKRA